MAQESPSGDMGGVLPWEPERLLRKVEPLEAKFSRGFLRCRPERWFPGFGAQWLPLGHSLGVEVEISEVKPTMVVPPSFDYSYWGVVDDEPFGMCFDEVSALVMLDTLCPGVGVQAGAVVLEYIARRVLTGVTMSWSGPAFSNVRFLGAEAPQHGTVSGAIKVSVLLNENSCSFCLCLGRFLVEKLDGLWRRQIQATAKRGDEKIELALEVAHLTVPPSMLNEYLKSGTDIDLEVAVTDIVTVKTSDKPWLPARLCVVGDAFGLEMLGGAAAQSIIPEGTTRLAVELGSVNLERGLLTELSQPGAILQTEIPVSNSVSLVINREIVRKGSLCAYEGRFAVTVTG